MTEFIISFMTGVVLCIFYNFVHEKNLDLNVNRYTKSHYTECMSEIKPDDELFTQLDAQCRIQQEALRVKLTQVYKGEF